MTRWRAVPLTHQISPRNRLVASPPTARITLARFASRTTAHQTSRVIHRESTKVVDEVTASLDLHGGGGAVVGVGINVGVIRGNSDCPIELLEDWRRDDVPDHFLEVRAELAVHFVQRHIAADARLLCGKGGVACVSI